MGWYCPVKKRECDRDLQRNGNCLYCPWPSPQMKVGSTAIDYPGPDDNPDVAIYKQGLDAGRAAAIDEALKTIEDNLDKLTAGEIIDAIRALAPK